MCVASRTTAVMPTGEARGCRADTAALRPSPRWRELLSSRALSRGSAQGARLSARGHTSARSWGARGPCRPRRQRGDDVLRHRRWRPAAQGNDAGSENSGGRSAIVTARSEPAANSRSRARCGDASTRSHASPVALSIWTSSHSRAPVTGSPLIRGEQAGQREPHLLGKPHRGDAVRPAFVQGDRSATKNSMSPCSMDSR